MSLTARIANLLLTKRRKEIDHFMRNPHRIQQQQLQEMIKKAEQTAFGEQYCFGELTSEEKFASRVPVCDYESMSRWMDQIRQGAENITWPGTIRWFAKSSGTTGAKSKFIPVSDQGLRQSHLKGTIDVMCLFLHNHPESHVLRGKALTLGGSHRLQTTGGSALEGDLSAILIQNTPRWASCIRSPRPETALIPDFEEKVRAIARETTHQRITSFAGVPSWNLVMMNKILEQTGKENILEVWPHMELFVHGGMSFAPYRAQYEQLFPSESMKYMETYNASEGFFGIQNDPSESDLLLMLDYGIYYEFLPVSSLHDCSQAVPLEGVTPGVNYAMIISTCNGLWRYMLGDTVEFTSTDPYKIKITGRTKLFINAFGEELMIDNAEQALQAACQDTGAEIHEYTAGPIYMGDRSKGSHEWLIEFHRPPEELSRFTETLDRTLQTLNSDYEAKRFKDTTLLPPTVTVMPSGTFYEWMKRRGKVGGQNKVPRLYNDRTYIDELLAL